MTNAEARALFPADRGKLIGLPIGEKRPLLDAVDNTSGFSMEFVATRGGKTSRAAAMIAYWDNALAVFDPAAELAHMTWRLLRAKGRRVFILSPDADPTDADGNPLPWKPLIALTNIIGWIDPSHPMAELHVLTAAGLFLESDAQKSHTGVFFDASVESLLCTLLAHVIWGDDPSNLRSLRGYLELSGVALKRKLLEIQQTSRSSFARSCAGPLYGAHSETFGDIHLTADKVSRWLSMKPLADMVCGDDFDLTQIADDPRAAIFLQIPMHVCQSFPTMANVVFGTIQNLKITNPGKTHVLALIDEAWMLKARAIREIVLNGGKYGIAMHMLWQAVSDVDRVWGKETRQSFFSNAAWIAFGPQGDVSTAKEISDACGTYSAMAYSRGDNSSTQAGTGAWGRMSRGRNLNQHPVKRSLFYPHEIMQDIDRNQRLILRLQKPLLVDAAPYFNIPALRGLISESPYTR